MDKQNLSQRIELLKEISIFSFLDDLTMEVIAERLEPRVLQKGDCLFCKGDKSQSAYLLESGNIQVHDEDYVFATLGPPEIFGEYALLDQKARSASVTALEPTHLYEFSRADFDEIVNERPEIKDSILTTLLAQLRQRNDLEEEMARKNAEIQRQKEEIEKQRDEIQAQKELKDRFFSIISHDLRGPVGAFQGIVDIMRMYIDKGKIEDLKEMMEEVEHSSSQLSRLLDNLLNWASTEQGQISYNPESIDVAEMVSNLRQNLLASANAKKIEITSDIPTDTIVWVDRNTTSTIFRNLVHNALKFTPEGGCISVKGSSNEDHTTISITDTGVGMNEETLSKLHVLKAKSTYGTSGEKGVGLGLQLVREFIRLNKGELAIQSEEGKGSTFSVTLPSSSPDPS